MASGMDSKKMAEVQQTSGAIKAEIRILHKKHELHLKFIPTTSESLNFVKTFLPQFSATMASQLGAFFSITGEIIDVDKD